MAACRPERRVIGVSVEGCGLVTPVSPMHIDAPPEPRLLLGFSGLTGADVVTRRPMLGTAPRHSREETSKHTC